MKNEPAYKIIIFLVAAWIIIFLALIISFKIGFYKKLPLFYSKKIIFDIIVCKVYFTAWESLFIQLDFYSLC